MKAHIYKFRAVPHKLMYTGVEKTSLVTVAYMSAENDVEVARSILVIPRC